MALLLPFLGWNVQARPGGLPASGMIELNLRNIPLKKALKEIERQTHYHFVVNDSQLQDIQKEVTITIRSENIEEVLSQLLMGTNVTYRIKKRQITLTPSVHDRQTSMLTASAPRTAFNGVAWVANQPLFVYEPVAVLATVITGTVKDETGSALPGVNVVVKGTSIGAVTDADGNFSLNVPEDDAVLVLTFIGYLTQEIPLNNQTVINVQMEPDSKTLSEVVVVGYGTQEKKDVTGSISAVKGSDFENLPTGGAQQALQGRAAGVNVVRNGGAPGNAGNILIRGLGTVNNADPLIVIDGVPAGNMNDVNPNDIQSLDVLKDASASAIYGTRAANGVVLITTKRGKFDDKLKITVNAYTGVSHRIKTLDVLDAPTLTQLKQESFNNDGAAIPALWQDPQYQTQKTNWQDEVFTKGTTDNIDLSIRGGGKYSSFAISGGKYSEKGIIGNSYYKRYTFRINSDHKIGERLKIGQSLQFTNTNDNAPNTLSAQDGLLWSAIRFHPGLPVRNAYGNYSSSIAGFGDINNPLYTIDTQDKNNSRNRILGSATAEYEILTGLKAKANLAVDATFSDTYNFEVKVDSQYRQTNFNQLTLTNDKNWSFLQEYFLSYDKTFGDHAVAVVAGYTSQTYNDIYSKQVGRNFASEDPSLRYMSRAGLIVNQLGDNGGRSYDALQSWFGRVNYSFKDRYLVTGTFRADGSSRFRDGLQWGTFPAFSVGWRVSEESFFRDNVSFISNLKLTSGWGGLGNQNVNRNQYLALLTTGYPYAFGNTGTQDQVSGTAQNRLSNPNIGWETAQMTNIGLDAGILDNRVLLTLAYFVKDTKDMLLSPPSLGTLGSAAIPDQNVGQLRNKGLEVEVSYRKTTGDFTFTLSGNATFIQNRITQLLTPGSFLASQNYGRTDQEITRSYVGNPFGTFYGWHADGVYQNQQQIDSDPNIANDSRRTQGQIHPGDVRFTDQNGDGIIDDKDRGILGSPQPKVNYGINASFGFKGFDLNLFFLGVGGVDLYNADRMQGLNAQYPFNLYQEVTGRWTGDGTSNTLPRLSSEDPNLNFRTSNLFVESGAFFRLKNITLGYTIPKVVTNALRMTSARFYMSGQNVFTVTKYKGLNPELGFASGNRQAGQYPQLGVDYAQYPLSRTFTLGATLTF
ncbi:SusC/RagA family TonB-linked outer membrane protein [Chryseolinea sp. Jin1]|uniref:SusC/RagA family TonB-linked outer membrane protein n=2 Tax=Chryseolinea lacunae TaxID=2801331 RepID=A0ABS1KJR0_9BACT|nr:SusC/RagA family TonB-linked outer membrane protein [Chryseolinea lacunae]